MQQTYLACYKKWSTQEGLSCCYWFYLEVYRKLVPQNAHAQWRLSIKKLLCSGKVRWMLKVLHVTIDGKSIHF